MRGQGVNGISIVFRGHTSICLLSFGFFLLVGYLSIDKYLSLVGNGWWQKRVGGGGGLEKGKSWRRGRAGEGPGVFLVLIDKVEVFLVLLATLSVLLTTRKT